MLCKLRKKRPILQDGKGESYKIQLLKAIEMNPRKKAPSEGETPFNQVRVPNLQKKLIPSPDRYPPYSGRCRN
jgi:hypothetical protein